MMLKIYYVFLCFCCWVPTVYGQQTVRGIVTDRNGGGPLPNVTVFIMETNQTVQTDIQGKYEIVVQEGGKRLMFSLLGYARAEAPISERTVINVMLESEARGLDEVVVVGYGEIARRDLTGAVSSIGSAEISKSKVISLQEGMQGRVSGVQITSSSGEPGAAININIRGANSINAGSTPLYVIDGVQIDANAGESASFSSVTNPLTSINPADIASIEVLKDASATAIFGSRGANGVVMVTTKSGSGQSSLDLDIYSGLSMMNKKFDVIGGQDFANYRYALNPNDTNWGEDIDGDSIPDRPVDVSGLRSYNWQDEVLRPGLMQNYNVAYSNGGPKTRMSVSAGYLNQEGILRNNGYERFSTNLKIDQTINSKLKVGTSVNGAYVLNKGVGSSSGQTLSFNGVIQNLLMYRPVVLPDVGLGPVDPESLNVSNPLDFVNYSQKSSPFTRLVANMFGEYKFLPELTLRLSGGGVLTNSKNGEFYPSTTSWGFSRNGMAILNKSNTTNYFQSHTLTYNKTVDTKHRIGALLGFETNTYIFEAFNMRAEGFDIQSINGVDNIHQAKVITQLPTTEKSKRTRMSEFGRLNYTFDDRYLFTATLRRDGSSVFGANNKYAWFPSGALAWNVSNEPFLRGQTWLSNLKVRTSFGITGNDRIPPYQALAIGSLAFYSGVETADVGLAITSMANPALKWETTYQYDAGVDVSFFKNRLNVTLDVYQKQTKDMLLYADIPGQSGFSKQWQNIGQVDNRGIEFAANANVINRKNFSWDVNFNITMNRSEVVSLGGAGFLPIRISAQIADVGRVVKGEPLGTGYGYVFDGIYQTDDFVDPASGVYELKEGVVKRTGISVRPGDFKFRDLNGDGEVDNVNDMQVISNSNPMHFGGLTNSFRYKDFDLSTLLVWSYGSELLNIGKYRFEGYQNSNLSRAYWDGHWTPENPTHAYPRLNATGRFDNSSYYVEDGSFLRLKNVVLGYNFQEGVARRLGMTQFRAYVAAENLLTWTNYSGFDPELASNTGLLPGIDNISYPRARVFTIGINAKF